MRSIIAFLLLCVPLLADERPGRVLFFHASWCKPCVEALEGPQEFPDWLRKAGWKIGVGPENHIQLVDIDRRDDLKTIYNIERPHLENCLHHPDGWCLDCVKDQHEEMEKYQALWVRCLPAVRASADYSCGRISFNDFVSIIEDYHSVNQEDSCDHE
ncbi:MAG: hypothetical protein EBW87_01750 [Burkholderiaceae bacterium]|nr:hypothetical protein [Burkholderiaceae bacterium]